MNAVSTGPTSAASPDQDRGVGAGSDIGKLGRHPRGYARVEADAYFTLDAPWIVPALLDHVPISGRVLEPAAGRGHLVRELRAQGLEVAAADLHVHEHPLVDLIEIGLDVRNLRSLSPYSWLITNFPYKLQDEILHRLLPIAARDQCGLAILTRHQWLCAQRRRDIVHEHPNFAGQIVLTSRPVWIEGTRGGAKEDYTWCIWWPEPRPARVAPFLKFAGRLPAAKSTPS
jgi:hypothetical protein